MCPLPQFACQSSPQFPCSAQGTELPRYCRRRVGLHREAGLQGLCVPLRDPSAPVFLGLLCLLSWKPAWAMRAESSSHSGPARWSVGAKCGPLEIKAAALSLEVGLRQNDSDSYFLHIFSIWSAPKDIYSTLYYYSLRQCYQVMTIIYHSRQHVKITKLGVLY